MKVEPVEYLVTFEDGEKPLKISHFRYGYAVHDFGLYYLGLDCTWHAGSMINFTGTEVYFKTMEDALETLKKWKEKQDEAI